MPSNSRNYDPKVKAQLMGRLLAGEEPTDVAREPGAPTVRTLRRWVGEANALVDAGVVATAVNEVAAPPGHSVRQGRLSLAIAAVAAVGTIGLALFAYSHAAEARRAADAAEAAALDSKRAADAVQQSADAATRFAAAGEASAGSAATFSDAAVDSAEAARRAAIAAEESANAAARVVAVDLVPRVEMATWPNRIGLDGELESIVTYFKNVTSVPVLNVAIDVCFPAGLFQRHYFATIEPNAEYRIDISTYWAIAADRWPHLPWELRAVYEDTGGSQWRTVYAYDPDGAPAYVTRVDMVVEGSFVPLAGKQLTRGPCDRFPGRTAEAVSASPTRPPLQGRPADSRRGRR